MSIHWLSTRDMEARLRRDYPPIGLVLRPFVHVRVADSDIRAWAGFNPGIDEWLPGLGLSDAWCAFEDHRPFSVIGAWNGEDYGATFSLPVKVTDQGVLDMGMLEVPMRERYSTYTDEHIAELRRIYEETRSAAQTMRMGEAELPEWEFERTYAMMDAFHLSVSQCHPLIFWPSDIHLGFDDRRLDSLLIPEIEKNRASWDPRT